MGNDEKPLNKPLLGMDAEAIHKMMSRHIAALYQVLDRWNVFGQDVINGAFHRNMDQDMMAARATQLIEDTEDLID